MVDHKLRAFANPFSTKANNSNRLAPLSASSAISSADYCDWLRLDPVQLAGCQKAIGHLEKPRVERRVSATTTARKPRTPGTSMSPVTTKPRHKAPENRRDAHRPAPSGRHFHAHAYFRSAPDQVFRGVHLPTPSRHRCCAHIQLRSGAIMVLRGV